MANKRGRPIAKFCSNGHEKAVVGTYLDRRCKLCHQKYLAEYRQRTDRAAKERERRRLFRLAIKEAEAKEHLLKVKVTWE